MQQTDHAAPPIFKSEAAANDVRTRYQALLRSWPVPNEQLYLPTCQGETFVVASGPKNAPALLLLHGTMANAAAWMQEVVTWAKEYRVYAVDIIGDAGLSAPSRRSFATDAHALWLGDVLDGLGASSVTPIGTSLGGAIALDFAIRRPQRVDSLVLNCPGGIADKNVLWWALPLLLLGPWGARKVRERIIGKVPPPQGDAARQYAELTDLTFQSMTPRTESLPKVTDQQLGQLPMPILVLLGGQDVTMDARRIKQRFEQHVSGAEILLFGAAAHYLGDQSAAIAQFLRRVYAKERSG